MGETYEQKLDRAKRSGITVSENFTESLRKKENIVGVYKFFRCKGNEEYCFYIGKSTNIVYRLLGSSSGHIYMFLHDDFSKIVPSKIKEFLAAGYKIRVDVCEISYYDTSFSKAAHRLALAELQEIVKYQEMGQCLFQVPEGVGTYEEQFWEENYKKE